MMLMNNVRERGRLHLIDGHVGVLVGGSSQAGSGVRRFTAVVCLRVTPPYLAGFAVIQIQLLYRCGQTSLQFVNLDNHSETAWQKFTKAHWNPTFLTLIVFLNRWGEIIIFFFNFYHSHFNHSPPQ